MPAGPPKQRKVALVGSRSVGKHTRLPLQGSYVLGTNSIISTGKSSLTVRYVDGHFVESYYPTIENTFSKVIRYKGADYATEIIDTAGQVRENKCADTHGSRGVLHCNRHPQY
jgi:hypothetical protein